MGIKLEATSRGAGMLIPESGWSLLLAVVRQTVRSWLLQDLGRAALEDPIHFVRSIGGRGKRDEAYRKRLAWFGFAP